LLDSFFNHLAFDPSEFLRMSAAKQGEVMVSVAGVEEDVKAKREEHARLYEERTNVNHDKAKAEASLADMKEPAPGGPREETPSTDILNQIDDANEHNKANAEKRKELQDLYATHAEVKKSLSEQDALIEDLENQLEKARAKRQEIAMELDAVVERGQDMRPEVAALVDKDTESLRAKLATLDADTKLARDAAAYRAKKDEVAAHDTASKKLTARMDEIKAEIGLIMAGSKLPIEGLSVDTSGSVLFNGKPFNQASSAETLEVSLAMGAAMNPRLRFLTLREASMMDDETRDSVVEWARKNGYFVLLELATSKDFGIHIENGLVTSVSESSEVKGE
jgi:myosin heavy subunit